MRDGYYAITISVVFHLVLVLLFFGMSAKPLPPAKPMLSVFTIYKEDFDRRQETVTVSRPAAGGTKGGERAAAIARPAEKNPVSPPTQIAREENQADVRNLSSTGPVAETVSMGQIGPSVTAGNKVAPDEGGHWTPNGTDRVAAGGESRATDQQTLVRFGGGGRVESDYSYIRAGIMGNINYPERARRMGWEGTVLLAFEVLENGSIEHIRILKSSGLRVLDEGARDAVAKTIFARRASHPLSVEFPVEFRLR